MLRSKECGRSKHRSGQILHTLRRRRNELRDRVGVIIKIPKGIRSSRVRNGRWWRCWFDATSHRLLSAGTVVGYAFLGCCKTCRDLRESVVMFKRVVQSSPIGWTERLGYTRRMEERLDGFGRGGIYTESRVIFPPTFATRRSIQGWRCSFLTLAAGWRHVSNACKCSIVLWRLDVCLNDLAEIDDDIATHGPASCTITTCLDGNRQTVFLTEDDGSRRRVIRRGCSCSDVYVCN